MSACHCLCAKAHPDTPGICDAYRPVTTRRFVSDLLGTVDVPLCGPCATAQGVPLTPARVEQP